MPLPPLVVRVVADTSGLKQGAAMAKTALLAIAGVSVKMALDYEKSFQRISAVTNTSQKQISKWRDQVLTLSGQTARAPQELADALYHLSSAGLDAADIMPTLAMSAKAAASGLGETQDIARLTANAMNAYAKSGLTAAQVTDTLVAAVREGTAEPTEFADAMGRILPIASKAGVEFDELAASLSVLSNIGLDVNEGVTAMRSLLSALVAPGSQAAETMKKIGIGTEEMRRVISEQGILGALRLLEDRTNGNIDTMRKIVPNIRALTGAFGLTTQEARKVNAIFENVRESSGSMGKAFEKTRKGPAFQMEQSLNNIRIAMIELGQKLLPVAQKIVEAVTSIAEAFTALPGGVQNFILALGGLWLISGPLKALVGGFRALGVAVGLLTGAKVAATAGTQLQLFSTGAAAAGKSLLPLLARMVPVVGAIAGLAVVGQKLGDIFGTDMAESMETFRAHAADASVTSAQLQDQIDGNRRAWAALGKEGEFTEAAAFGVNQAFINQLNVLRSNVGIVGQATIRAVEMALGQGRLADATRLLNDGLARTRGRTRGVLEAANALTGGLNRQQRVTAEQAVANERWGAVAKMVTRDLKAQVPALQKQELGQIRSAVAAGKGQEAMNILQGVLDRLTGKSNVATKQTIALRNAINSLRSKTVTITAIQKYVQQGSPEGAKTIGQASLYGAQHGFHGMVSQPTLFLAGEAGPERVDVTPAKGHRGGQGLVVNNDLRGSVIYGIDDLNRVIEKAMSKALLGTG